MNEVWKDIPGIPEYRISSLGRVWSKKRGIMMRQAIHTGGYLRFAPRVGGRYKSMYIHRAVAMAFLSCADPSLEVNHKNFNKKDNRVENLEWCSRKDNLRHSFAAGRHDAHFRMQRDRWQGEGHPRATLTNDQVRNIRADHKSGIGPSALVKKYSTTISRIEHIVYGSAWKNI